MHIGMSQLDKASQNIPFGIDQLSTVKEVEGKNGSKFQVTTFRGFPWVDPNKIVNALAIDQLANIWATTFQGEWGETDLSPQVFWDLMLKLQLTDAISILWAKDERDMRIPVGAAVARHVTKEAAMESMNGLLDKTVQNPNCRLKEIDVASIPTENVILFDELFIAKEHRHGGIYPIAALIEGLMQEFEGSQDPAIFFTMEYARKQPNKPKRFMPVVKFAKSLMMSEVKAPQLNRENRRIYYCAVDKILLATRHPEIVLLPGNLALRAQEFMLQHEHELSKQANTQLNRKAPIYDASKP
jgi:hypothetical protein